MWKVRKAVWFSWNSIVEGKDIFYKADYNICVPNMYYIPKQEFSAKSFSLRCCNQFRMLKCTNREGTSLLKCGRSESDWAVCAESEDEDHCTGRYRTDWTAPGHPGAAAGSHGHRRCQEPRENRCASWQSQGNVAVGLGCALSRFSFIVTCVL